MLQSSMNDNKENAPIINHIVKEELPLESVNTSDKVLLENNNICNLTTSTQSHQQDIKIQKEQLELIPSPNQIQMESLPYDASAEILDDTSNGINRAQQLLNDVRALTLQNQKSEQNIRDLQQKINVQKDKRFFQINGAQNYLVENKENKEEKYYSKPVSRTNFNLGNDIKPATTRHLYQYNQSRPSLLKASIDLKVQSHQVDAPQTISQTTEEQIIQEKYVTTIQVKLARDIINKNYSLDILNNIIGNEHITVPKNSLLKHKISTQLRAKMVDWMIEVMKSYNASEEAFFMAVRIMDYYLEKTKEVKGDYDIHLIGVTCIFIACKFEEIVPIRLQVVEERIAHRKLTSSQIIAMEADILNTLNFNLIGTSPYEIMMQTLTYSGYQETLSAEEFNYGQKIGVYLSKMALYDYEFNKTATYSLLATSVIFIVFKIFQQINPSFLAEAHIKPIQQILKIDSKQLVNWSTRILNLAKNFEYFFPHLHNLKKFNGFEMKENNTFNS